MTILPDGSTPIGNILAGIDAKRNLPLGIAMGFVGAILGAVLWAMIAFACGGWQWSITAILVAFIVGWFVRRFGSGRTKVFGYAGAALSLVGVALGNVLEVYSSWWNQERMPFSDLVSTPFGDVIAAVVHGFGPIDVMFYVITVYSGYRYSIRTLTREEMMARR